MKSKIYKAATILSSLIFIFFVILRCSLYNFNSENVKKNIGYLSSEKFSGRLCGSKENSLVSDILEKELETLGLSKFNGIYKENFNVVTPYSNNTKPTLSLEKDGKDIKSFEYGVNYKEDMINFKKSNITLSSKDNLKILPSSICFNNGEDIFLFYVNEEDNFNFRSSFVYDSPISFAVCITKSTYDEIISYLKSGASLNVNLPFSLKETEVSNVIGKIDGKDKNSPPLILCAHFDHLGKDYLGNIYEGALDNASGTSFLLELANTLKSLPKPNRDIIFIFLNGEEFGLLGSKYFCEEYANSLKGATVINFDMIGAPNTDLTFMSGANSKDTDSKLLSDLEALCNKSNLDYNIKYEDASDHASFINSNIDTLTISHDDTSRIHTPNDKLEFISSESISDAYKLINSFILNECYDSKTNIILNKNLHGISFLVFLVLIGYPILKKVRKNKLSNN